MQALKLLVAGCGYLGLRLTDEQLRLFQVYQQVLIDWNKKFNLTAVDQPEEIETRHFLDSLTCFLVFPGVSLVGPSLRDLPSFDELALIDVGAGPGFPGLPLKIARPGIRLTLIESVGKKTTFLKHVVAQLGMKDVDVVTGRAEDVGRQPGHREAYDIALARAVAPLATLAEYCLPFVKVGGRFIAPKKGAIEAELQRAGGAIDALGGRLTRMQAVEIPDLLEPRFLVVVDKVRPTPPQFPRRAGMPGKKPL
ncbi:MAG: 16S rRNA (guanine(527)-N(7))-methyltransferase RsmG [Chloroflexi bacterium]|nr:16S rRNA (guanine(527)-N(7))-methyltransferase RsmG [Chloroflexota bacterium]